MPLTFTAITLVALPLFLCLWIALFRWREETLTRLLFFSNALYAAVHVLFLALFFQANFQPQQVATFQLFAVSGHGFDFVLLVDGYSVAFQTLIGFLTEIVLVFSARYMHREDGFRRFFASLYLFVGGISLVALSGNIDVLFAGWEIVGISSFLLIGFYRTRLQPGRNSVVVYAIYRFTDVGLLLSVWLLHKLNVPSVFLENSVKASLTQNSAFSEPVLFLIGVLILLAAMGKSAQFPFSFWMPRAMEGPTPSSAIFYGALSVHAGVFLLIRFFGVWQKSFAVVVLVGLVGSFSAIVANLCVKTQSNVKAKVAYASVAQVGLMFVELALGFPQIAMVHFIGNAALRCYQLLAAPSAMVFKVRHETQGVRFNTSISGFLLQNVSEKMRRRVFAFAFSDGFSEALIQSLWNGMKVIARLCDKLLWPAVGGVLVSMLFQSSFGALFVKDPTIWRQIFSWTFGVAAFLSAFAALGFNANPVQVLWRVGISILFKALSVVTLFESEVQWANYYFAFFAVGFAFAYKALESIPQETRLREYAGTAQTHGVATQIFFLSILWLSGFPLSPTFFAEDILLREGAQVSLYAAFFVSVPFVLNTVALMRSYTKLAFAR